MEKLKEYIKANYNILDNLCKKLQDNYNDDIKFEQSEEDRIVIYNILEIIDNEELKEIIKYKNILKEFKKDNISLIKLETLEHLQGFDNFNELQEEKQNKILDFVYSYWLESDLQEHTLFDYIELLANSNFYGYGDIFGNIEKLSYKDFINIVEEKEIL